MTDTTPTGDQTTASGDAPAARRRKDRHRAVPFLPEVRFWNGTLVEIRERTDTNEIVLSGTPIIYDKPYTVRDLFGEFTETMAPTVADDVIERGLDCRFLFNHDGPPLARTINGHTGGAGTMRLENTDTALVMTATLDARSQLSNDLMVAIERGDLAEMSCGFIVARDEWNEDFDERTILSFAELVDVSAVTYPCSTTTHIDVAQRMVAQMPIESRERLRKLHAVTRAGKVLSSANEAKLSSAHEAIAAVLDAATPPSAATDADDELDVVRHADGSEDAPTVNASADATEGGHGAGDTSAGSQGVQDATGSRSIPATEAERREAVLSYNDKESTLRDALVDRFRGDDDDYCDIWICDMGDDWIVFEAYSNTTLTPGTYRLSYAVGDGTVTLDEGDPERVQQQTSYVPVSSETSRASGVKFLIEARKRRRSL